MQNKPQPVTLWRVGIRNASGWHWDVSRFESYAAAEAAYHKWLTENSHKVYQVCFKTEIAYR